MDTIADSDSADMGSIPVRGIFLWLKHEKYRRKVAEIA